MKILGVYFILLVGELYGTTYCGYLYTTTNKDVFLWLIVMGCLITLLTSVLLTFNLIERRTKKVDRSKECPYFIEIDE